MPLLLVKLWTVYPRLFRRPRARGAAARRSTCSSAPRSRALVASAIFQLATGLANAAQWYPWDFSFRATHYAIAWVAIGALVVHIAVKLPIIRRRADLRRRVDRRRPADRHRAGRAVAPRAAAHDLGGGRSRRAGRGGQHGAVPASKVSVFAVRTGEGPQGVPINKSAAAAHITDEMVGSAYRLEVVHGDRSVVLTREELRRMTQRTEQPPDRLRRGVERGRGVDRRPGA